MSRGSPSLPERPLIAERRSPIVLDARAAETLIERYGDDIRTVSTQVSNQFSAKRGTFGHGWEIVAADDIEQAVYEQFIRSGVTADDLDSMNSSQAYIRTTARYYGANNEARARRRAVQAHYQEALDEERATIGSVIVTTRATDHSDTYPEKNLLLADLLEAIESTVVDLIKEIRPKAQQAAARLFYLGGLDANEIAKALGAQPHAIRKALQRAREHLGLDADASLRAYREFTFPAAKRPQVREGTPTALVKVVREHGL